MSEVLCVCVSDVAHPQYSYSDRRKQFSPHGGSGSRPDTNYSFPDPDPILLWKQTFTENH